MSGIANMVLKITNTKLYDPIFALSTKGNVNLTKQFNEGFKRPVYWNEYKTTIESRNLGNNSLTIFYLDASFQGVKRLFILAFDNTTLVANNNTINGGPSRIKKDLSHTKS